MELFILRHGQAEPYSKKDAQRQLVDIGRREVEEAISSSLDDLQPVAQIWISPLVRAQQTAEIASRLLPHALLQTLDILVPDADPVSVFEKLAASKCQSLLLVSHQPLVSTLCEMACGVEPGYYSMSTASLACVDFDAPAAGLGQLRWLRHVAN